jgi:predicted dehydrogenase
VIGCGAIATQRHIPQLQAAGAVVTAVASRRPESAAAVAAGIGTATACASWEELVARDDVDAVAVCTPNSWHGKQALAAIEAGKHVLVEKPVTTTVADADALVAAAARRGVIGMVAHDARFVPAVEAMREAVRRGDVGKVHSASGWLGHGGPQQWAPDATWFRDAELAGGGALLDLGVHLVDTLRCLLHDEFAQVACELAPTQGPVDEDGIVLFRTARGVTGTLHASWRSATGPTVGLRVIGDGGSLVWDGGAVQLRRPDGSADDVAVPAGSTSPQAEFVSAVEGGRAAPPDLCDGRAAVAVIEAAYTAARSGRRTEVAPS